MKRLFCLLSALFMIVGCHPDYGMYYTKVVEGVSEPEVIVITEIQTKVIVVPEYIEVEIEVEVEADYGEIWVDSFTQLRSVDGVDILWVIDTSGSMHAYNTQLLLGIEAMLNALPTNDWRLAMIAADGYYSENEAQFPLLPGDDIIDAENMYNNMIKGHREAGFDSVYRFMIGNTYAQTWMRSDAALLVVFVSDEEEQSTIMANVSDFTNWYESLRGGSVFVSSVVNVPAVDSVCASPPSGINVGDRYMDATNYFNGQIVDICDTDWSAGVNDATQQMQPYESWELTHSPGIEDSIRVFIDGQLNWDWTYDAAINTIYFTVLPPGDSLVEIGYLYYPTSDPDTGDTGN